MSKARQRATQTREKGAARRRNWDPEAGSAHYRVYKWWLDQIKYSKRPVRENFCHYWRVVLLWAPLRWLVRPLLYVLGAAIAVLLIWVAVANTDKTLGVIIGLLAGAYVLYGLAVGKQLLHDLDSSELDDVKAVPWLDDKSFTVRALAVLSALPVLIAAAPLVLIAGTVFAIVTGIHDDYDGYGRLWRWSTGTHFGKSKWIAWIRPWLVVPLAMLGMSFVNEHLRKAVVNILVFGGVIAAWFGIIALAAYLSDRAKEQRKERIVEERRARNKVFVDQVMAVMFTVVHPEWVGDSDRFESWKARYVRWCRETLGRHEYDIPDYAHITRLTERRQTEVYKRLDQLRSERGTVDYIAVTPLKEPSWLRVALRATIGNVGDFLSLVWSAVLAWKWKFCPWVELPD